MSATILPESRNLSCRKSSSQDAQDMTVCQGWCYIAVILNLFLFREGCRKMVHKPQLQGLGILILCVSLSPTMTAAQQPALNLIPIPANVQAGSGSLRVDLSFTVALTGHSEPRLDRAAERFLRQLALQTALPLSPKQ